MTGQIGQVMQESMQAALTWFVRMPPARRARRFLRQPRYSHPCARGRDSQGRPSAGVTMATALVSLLTGHRITPLIAMTGEITLSGTCFRSAASKRKSLRRNAPAFAK